MRSPERAQHAPGLPIYPAGGGARLSIDWFRRRPPVPAWVSLSPLAWTAWCERQADDHFAPDDRRVGTWHCRAGGASYTLYTRYDDGISPCLYRVE